MWFGLDKLLLGVDVEAEDAANQRYEADTARWQQQQYESGQWTASQYQQAQANLQNQVNQNANVTGQVNDAFAEGAQEGLSNAMAVPGKIVGGVTNASGQLLWGILKNIPWWLWIAGAVALFFYLGGGVLLKGRLKRYA